MADDIISDDLRVDMDSFDARVQWLEKHHNGKFVVFCAGEFVDAFDTFDAAARAAIRRYGAGPYLIRQVGRPRGFSMPASVAYCPVRAAS